MGISESNNRGPNTQLLVFAAILLSILALHFPLLPLPYFWDEAGYYIPAARDLFLSGSLIPHSTVSNAHPPLVLAWLALWWKLAGFSPVITRLAMLMISAFTLLGIFLLATLVANPEVAVASTLCTALYPVFFTQSSLAHLDMAAAGLTLWGLKSYLQSHRWKMAGWFSLAALAKETAIVAPLALLVWEIFCRFSKRPLNDASKQGRRYDPLVLAASLLPLGAWFAYHYARTGFIFGNPEFFRYNVTATLHPLRIVLAAGMRMWQLTGYLHLWLLTIAAGLAMFLAPREDVDRARRRIDGPVQAVFLLLIFAYVGTMAVVGGAVLARYMLPVLPLVIILFVSTLWRRVQYWKWVVAIACAAFVLGWFVNPPYGFAFEDNLAYRDYILLHKHAEQYLAAHRPTARVLTAWPASDELTRSYLGYVNSPMRVMQIDDFSYEQVASAADVRSQYDVALVFSTKFEPAHPVLQGWRAWDEIKRRFFGFHHDLPAAVIARMLNGNVIYEVERNGQWIAVIDIPHEIEAALPGASAFNAIADGTSASSRSATRRRPGADTTSRALPESAAPACRCHS